MTERFNKSTAITRRGLIRLGGSAACLLGLGLFTVSLTPAGASRAYAGQLVGDVNDEGEYSFVPDDSLTLEDLPPEPQTFASSSQVGVVNLGGSDRYETAAKEALYAFSSSSSAIVAGGAGYADSIAAAGLAGALSCPILLTAQSYVPDATMDALVSLGVKNIVLIGGESAASSAVEATLRGLGSVERLSGSDRYETQMKIYRYGADHGLWTGDTAVVANGTGFADALSVSPISYALKAPVFFCDGSQNLPAEQRRVLSDELDASNFLLIGGAAVTSPETESFLRGLSSLRGGETVRLGGSTRYATSMKIARYAVKNLGFTWDGVAFASGRAPYDSLGGGVVQGREKSVLLLADAASSESADVILEDGGSVNTTIKFFGGSTAIPGEVRANICARLGVRYLNNTSFIRYDIARSRMAELQVARGESNDYGYDDFYDALDPDQYEYGQSSFNVFALLDLGYSGVTAEDINEYVANNCSYSEQSYGRPSQLRTLGSAFVDAAGQYQLNEVYLLSHACWESGWGCSELAGGWTPDEDGEVVVNGVTYPYKKGETYYNFYGIGAVDENALSGGRTMAVKEGWTTPRLAVLGAAKWISENYLHRSSGAQNTLYLMKYDVVGAVKSGSAWHEYCTGLSSWCTGISSIMQGCYKSAGTDPLDDLQFSVPVYAAE